MVWEKFRIKEDGNLKIKKIIKYNSAFEIIFLYLPIMRTRSWRRSKSESIVKNRLIKFHRNNWYRFKTANGDLILNHKWFDEIGLGEHFFFKNHTTDKYSTDRKIKYSLNKSKSYYRTTKISGDSLGNREKDHYEFFQILKENGLK